MQNIHKILRPSWMIRSAIYITSASAIAINFATMTLITWRTNLYVLLVSLCDILLVFFHISHLSCVFQVKWITGFSTSYPDPCMSGDERLLNHKNLGDEISGDSLYSLLNLMNIKKCTISLFFLWHVEYCRCYNIFFPLVPHFGLATCALWRAGLIPYIFIYSFIFLRKNVFLFQLLVTFWRKTMKLIGKKP